MGRPSVILLSYDDGQTWQGGILAGLAALPSSLPALLSTQQRGSGVLVTVPNALAATAAQLNEIHSGGYLTNSFYDGELDSPLQ